MTHTNHRQGSRESLSRDYIVMMIHASGINDQNTGPRLQEFLRIGYRYEPVNAGPTRLGDAFMSSRESILKDVALASNAHLVFDDRSKVEAFVKDLVKADLGLSVVVSGLFDEVAEISQQAGLKPHTCMCSLGIWGRTDRLPPAEILDITTMCGHGLVSANLARRMAYQVSKGQVSLEEAGRTLARPCSCGVFNTGRAEKLLGQYIAKSTGE